MEGQRALPKFQVIRLNGISRRYGDGRTALESVDLHVREGEFAVVTGPSGSGKTTLFRILVGEEVPDTGTAIVDGRNLSRLNASGLAELRHELGLVFEDPRLIDRLCVSDNVALAAEVAGAGRAAARDMAKASLERVGMGGFGHCFPADLSGGERQFVGLARALVNDPILILADEPTLNLDPDYTLEMLRILTECCRGGTTVFMASHDMEALSVLRCRILLMNKGRLRPEGRGESAFL